LSSVATRQLDVDPRLGELAGGGRGALVAAQADDLEQLTGDVPAHPQQRMDQHPDLRVVAVQPGGDGVDQVRHVVGDDIHHQAGRGAPVQLGLPGVADADQGPALRPVQAEPGVRVGHRGQP
jgi:hypothetical protein